MTREDPVARLTEALATCRELREYDRAEIEKLRAENLLLRQDLKCLPRRTQGPNAMSREPTCAPGRVNYRLLAERKQALTDIVERLVALANSLGGTEEDDIMAGVAEIARLRAERDEWQAKWIALVQASMIAGTFPPALKDTTP